MGCPTNDALLEYAERSRDPAPTIDNVLDSHLTTCKLCRRFVDDIFASGRTELALGTQPTNPSMAAASLPASRASFPTNLVQLGDRYEVKHMLGRGGMGAVYLARDRTLGRDVAIKLHAAGSGGGDRLHREAIAMAKLAHPNVVTVFEVSTYEDRLFVAMEYVKGGTLLTWLRAEPRSWRDIVEMMLATGEGLAAAHAAGLVHRDFKPENVLVGEDGRPRVGDFGIAHLEGRSSDREILSMTSDIDLTRPMTVTGALMGTPAYMAPEQITGEDVGVRADQFAFCVVAWELLYGRRPFNGTSLASLAANIALHDLDRPAKTAVPQRISAVLARGLAQAPADRFADMRSLLVALRRTIDRRRVVWIAAVAAAVPLAVAATLLARGSSGPTVDSCAGGVEQLAGAWDPAISSTLRDAFVADRPKDGADVHAHVATVLDAYAQKWVAGRRAACEASLSRGDQSDAAFDLRMSCLRDKRTELAAFTRGLAEAKGIQIVSSPRSATGLSSVDICGDVAALSSPVRPPDISVRSRVVALREKIAEMRAQRLLGKFKEARDAMKPIVAQAIDLKYRPVEAEALLLSGDVSDRAGDAEAGMTQTEQAIAAANAGNASLLSAEAWTQLAYLLSQREREFDRARTAVQMASSALESIGGNELLATQLLHYEALIYETSGKEAEAKARYLRALAIYEKLHDEPRLSLVLNDLGGLQRKMGDYDDARKTLERSLEIRTRLFGQHHPWVFSSVLNLGNVSFSQSNYAAAATSYRRALEIAAEVFPPNHPQVALALENLAASYNEMGDAAHAIETQRRAMVITEALRGADSPLIASESNNLGTMLADDGQLDAAKEAFERAYQIMKDAEDDPMLVDILSLYGELLIKLDPKAAEPMLLRSLKLGEAIDKTSPDLAYPLMLLGRLYAKTKRHAAARPVLERAVTLRRGDKSAAPMDVAITQYELAKVLWETSGDRPRALELVADGMKRMNDSGETKRPAYAEISAWLAEHSKR